LVYPYPGYPYPGYPYPGRYPYRRGFPFRFPFTWPTFPQFRWPPFGYPYGYRIPGPGPRFLGPPIHRGPIIGHFSGPRSH
jgi:serine protease AprX